MIRYLNLLQKWKKRNKIQTARYLGLEILNVGTRLINCENKLFYIFSQDLRVKRAKRSLLHNIIQISLHLIENDSPF